MKKRHILLALVCGILIGLGCTGCAKKTLEHRVGPMDQTIESR